jgi:RND family efflux transporter MFP subunit
MTAMAADRTRTVRSGAPVLVLLAAAAGAACGGPEHLESGGDAQPAVAVRTSVARMAELPDRFDSGGVVAADVSATVTSRVVAPVVEVRARAGDRVRAGQVLVVLDDQALGAQARQAVAATAAAEQGLTAARTEYAAAAADQKLADAWHARIAALHARKAATPQELDEAEARRAGAAARTAGAEARIEQGVAQVSASRAAAEAAATTHAFAVIRAPFDGLVTEMLTDPGNMASPGVPLVRLDSTGAARVDVRVDQSRAAYVRPGDGVEVVFDQPLPGAETSAVEGTVAEVARAISADEHAFTVKVSLPAAVQARTGTYVRARFRGPTRKVLVVPEDAIRRQGQVATVLVIDAGVARLRLVQAGAAVGEGVEVLAGLEAGETIVVAPPANLMDGQRVTVLPAAAGGAR